jgi:hypothetical protein
VIGIRDSGFAVWLPLRHGTPNTPSMNHPFVLVVVLVLDPMTCLRGRGRARGRVGSWSQCTTARPRGLHEPLEAPPGFGVRQSSGALAMQASQPKAPEDWRSPRRYRAVHRFEVPMHVEKRKPAFHEPQGAAGILPAEESEGSSAGETSAAPCLRHLPTRSRFIVPMRGQKAAGASHEARKVLGQFHVAYATWNCPSS